jgi:hypothetical protein
VCRQYCAADVFDKSCSYHVVQTEGSCCGLIWWYCSVLVASVWRRYCYHKARWVFEQAICYSHQTAANGLFHGVLITLCIIANFLILMLQARFHMSVHEHYWNRTHTIVNMCDVKYIRILTLYCCTPCNMPHCNTTQNIHITGPGREILVLAGTQTVDRYIHTIIGSTSSIKSLEVVVALQRIFYTTQVMQHAYLCSDVRALVHRLWLLLSVRAQLACDGSIERGVIASICCVHISHACAVQCCTLYLYIAVLLLLLQQWVNSTPTDAVPNSYNTTTEWTERW